MAGIIGYSTLEVSDGTINLSQECENGPYRWLSTQALKSLLK